MRAPFAQHWSVKEFIKFVLPSVMSLITISLYMMVDAVFVSRYAGPMALAAVNIVMPLFNLGIGMAIMTAAGSSAIIGIELGENQKETANRHFSLVFCFLLVLMAVFYSGVRLAGVERITRLLGASDLLAPMCTAYLEVFLFGITLVMLQLFFEYFIRLDGRPGFAFLITVASGLTNVVLDYWLITQMGMGIRGAGIASTAGILVAVAMGIGYFAFRPENLRPCRPVLEAQFIGRALVNGSSEMVTDLSTGGKILVFNLIIVQYAGEAGVAAMAIFMNLYFVMSSFHIGLIMGTAPVFSFNFGARNYPKIRQLTGQALKASIGASVVVFFLGQSQADNIIGWFTTDPEVFSIAFQGFKIFAFAFLVNGITILASGFFTAMGNGKISAFIAGMESIVFTLGFVAVLPGFIGISGIWSAVPLAEVCAMIMSVAFFMKFKRAYLIPDMKPNLKTLNI